MATRRSAQEQLERILQLIPLAARSEGILLDELARSWETDARDILQDLEEVYTRAYYHPAGGGDDPQILIEDDRVTVWTKGELRRPLKLSGSESIALGLGLRVLAAEARPADRASMLQLVGRLEAALAGADPEALLAHVMVQSAGRAGEDVRTALKTAVRDQTRCHISYLKPGAPEPQERVLDPYAILIAQGHWYTVAHCHTSDAIRVFRLDRISAIEPTDHRYDLPADFDPASFVSEGRVYRADQEIEVRVRYSPRIARWIREKGPVEEQNDGAVVVRHRVADPEWVVRHVLQYGPDALVIDPPEVREMVRTAAARLC